MTDPSAPAAPAPGPRRRLPVVLLTALFLAGFLLVSAAVRGGVPGPTYFAATPKLEHLRERVEDYDVVFIGSSRVFRGFVPEVFDREMEARGHSTRSFNLAARGMFAFEADHVLRQLLALDGFRARTVFIEPGIWNPVPETITNFTLRSAEWHTPLETRQALESTVRMQVPLRERVSVAWMHLELLARRQVAYGRGPDVVAHLGGWDGGRQLVTRAEVDRHRGWHGFDMENDPKQRMTWESLHRNWAAFEAQLDALRRDNARRPSIQAFNVDATRRQVDAVRAAGCEPIYVVPPGKQAVPLIRTAHEQGCFPAFLAYDDPDRYPELYTPAARHDADHLSRAGAELFTRKLAEHYALILEREARLEERNRKNR